MLLLAVICRLGNLKGVLRYEHQTFLAASVLSKDGTTPQNITMNTLVNKYDHKLAMIIRDGVVK